MFTPCHGCGRLLLVTVGTPTYSAGWLGRAPSDVVPRYFCGGCRHGTRPWQVLADPDPAWQRAALHIFPLPLRSPLDGAI